MREPGSSSVEYGLLVAFLCTVVIAAVSLLDDSVLKTFDHACDRIAAVYAQSCGD